MSLRIINRKGAKDAKEESLRSKFFPLPGKTAKEKASTPDGVMIPTGIWQASALWYAQGKSTAFCRGYPTKMNVLTWRP